VLLQLNVIFFKSRISRKSKLVLPNKRKLLNKKRLQPSKKKKRILVLQSKRKKRILVLQSNRKKLNRRSNLLNLLHKPNPLNLRFGLQLINPT
jgi:hypothetical protein